MFLSICSWCKFLPGHLLAQGFLKVLFHSVLKLKRSLAGKTSVVTGGNSGIGVETVRALASAGSRVILTSRSVEAGQGVTKQLKDEGVKVRRCLRVTGNP